MSLDTPPRRPPSSAFPHRILGIDPGSSVTGYGVVEVTAPGRTRYVECGVIRTDPNKSLDLRLTEIASGLREVIEEFEPDSVAMEDVFHHRNPRSALLLGQARGAALLVVAEAGLAVYSYPPAQIKKTVVGRGRASKQQVQKMVQTLCSLTAPPEPDAADAVAAALCHATSAWAPSSAYLGRRPTRRSRR